MLAGTMLASMLGGANNAAGSSGGGFAQMLGQIASSPAMQQLANSPTVQNAVQPLLDGGNSASGCEALLSQRLHVEAKPQPLQPMRLPSCSAQAASSWTG